MSHALREARSSVIHYQSIGTVVYGYGVNAKLEAVPSGTLARVGMDWTWVEMAKSQLFYGFHVVGTRDV
jgi:hypothetical protein